MPQENVKRVQRFLDLALEDPDAWEIFDDDVEWEVSDLRIPGFPDSFHGPDGVREFLRQWVGPFGNWGYEVEDVIDAGDTVLVHVHQWGSGRGSGATVEGRFWQVWVMREGKAIRVTNRVSKPNSSELAG
jgi:ketosteroid isomerase-like protein